MAYTFKNYSVRKNKIEKSYYEGFILGEGGRLFTTSDGERHILFLQYMDSGEENLEWGRLKIDAEIHRDAAISIRAFAVNQLHIIREDLEIDLEQYLLSKEKKAEDKEEIFRQEELLGAKSYIGFDDVLLYGLKGRYLWLCIELIGTGVISKINVDSPGDIMLDIFPEIYQEKGTFFHRYLSIFSSLFMDFEYKIEGLHKKMDLKTAPMELLRLFGEWMGLNFSGSYLEEETLRRLLLRLHILNCIKGTKQAILELTEILLEKPAVVVERNLLDRGDEEIYDKLYGNSPYDFTVLINGTADEQKQSQLLFWLNQFMPVRSRIHIVFLKKCGNLDTYCYLDINAAIYSGEPGVFDNHQSLDGSVILTS